MNTIEKIADLARQYGCRVRIKLLADDIPERWANGIGLPVEGYIELTGPWPLSEVEWLEINPAVSEWVGRLAKPKQHNRTDSLISMLQTEQVPYAIVDGMIRIPLATIGF